MPGFFTDYSNNKLLDLILGSAPFAAPATIYVGLAQNTSNKSGVVAEPTGGNYARVALQNNSASFPAAVTGTKSNSPVITFPAPTGDWGSVKSVFVADAAAGGNVLAMADLVTPRSVTAGSTAPKVASGALFFSHT